MKKFILRGIIVITIIDIVAILFLASCSKKDIQVPKRQTYFIRVGAVNPTDTIYSEIKKVN